MGTHICGQCKQEFSTERAYLNHVCSVTGFPPTDPGHLGEEFKAVSDAAVARGEARKLQEANPNTPVSEADIISAVRAARNAK